MKLVRFASGIVVLALWMQGQRVAAAAKPDFNDDIRPLLSDRWPAADVAVSRLGDRGLQCEPAVR